MMYIPDGMAHGFITLTDETMIGYQISESPAPSAARGVRWNDPIFGITWPIEPRVISHRDRDYSDFVR
jgi:dTDP-4-dehydrorhamnose 3,5-epimerase